MYRYDNKRRTGAPDATQMEGQPMTLQCQCGALELTITSQSYDGSSAFEAYECQICGRTGTLVHDETTGTTLSGCLQ